LGAACGLLAGLLGIGGGVVIVPVLVSYFAFFHLQRDLTMHYAAGTSFGIMIFTAISSVYQHKRLGHMIFPIIVRMLPWVVLGTCLGAIVARFLHSAVLSIIFGVFLLLISANMLFKLKGVKRYIHRKINRQHVRIVSTLIGLMSGMLGIGGGALTVPFLRYNGIPMKKSSGSAAFLTLPIALCGFTLFLILGLSRHTLPWATGYIYWPAILCVAPISILFANLGARLTHRLRPEILQIAFSLLLVVLGVKMLWISLVL